MICGTITCLAMALMKRECGFLFSFHGMCNPEVRHLKYICIRIFRIQVMTCGTITWLSMAVMKGNVASYLILTVNAILKSDI